MLSPFILIFQFFDNFEIQLVSEVESLQNCIFRLDPRFVSEADYDRFYRLKIKLDLLREIQPKILNLLAPYGKMGL